MKPGDDLFQLIHSLKKSETRYFRLFCGLQEGDKNYLKVFDALLLQQEYDEAGLRSKFHGEKFLNNFFVIKQYLYKQIIFSLRMHGAYKDLESDVSDLIEDAKVLEHKGLFRQAGNLLRRAGKKAERDESFLRLYYIYIKQYIAVLGSPGRAGKTDELHRLISERKKVLKQVEDYSFISDILFTQKFYLRKRQYCRTEKERNELKRIIAPLLELKQEDLLSFTSRGLYNMALCDHYNAMGLPKKAIAYAKNHLQLKEKQDPNKIELQTIAELSNYLLLCLKNGYLEEVPAYLSKFKAVQEKIVSADRFVPMYQRWLNYSVAYLNSSKKFRAGNELWKKEEKQYQRYENLLSKKERMAICYSVAHNYFGIKDHKNALHWLNKIINQEDTAIEEYGFAKLLQLIILYETDQADQLEYALRSTIRYLRKSEKLYKTESIILSFLQKAQQLKTNKWENELITLRGILLKNFKDPVENSIRYYFDWTWWLEVRSGLNVVPGRKT